jgi:hypothetical protein
MNGPVFSPAIHMFRRMPGRLAPLLLIFLLVQCSTNDPRNPKPQTFHDGGSLDSLLLKTLSAKRVVMLGDSYPGHASCSRLVTSFLEVWLDRLQHNPHDTTLPRNIALALELGRAGETVLNEYLKTGDRYPLMRFLIDEQEHFESDAYITRSLSTDYLQFCEGLRLVKTRVDSVNRRFPELSVSFEILGPEPELPYTYLDVCTKSRQEIIALKSRWDASQRGMKISSYLVQYLSLHPDHKLMVFVSSNHLFRDKQSGAYLARCLDSLLGRQTVSVFWTSRMLRNPVSSPQIEEFRHDGETADFLVRKSASPPYPFPFFVVRSQNTLLAMTDLAEQCSSSPDTLERDLSRTVLVRTLELLRYSYLALDPRLNGEIATLQSIAAAATRRAIMPSQMFPDIHRLISRFDPVRDVLEIDSVMVTFAPSQDYHNALTTIIDNLRKDSTYTWDNVRVVTDHKPVEDITAEWARSWKEKKSERRAYMLLQILWLGTPGEVSNALAALRKETGLRFSTAREWDEWWQSTH